MAYFKIILCVCIFVHSAFTGSIFDPMFAHVQSKANDEPKNSVEVTIEVLQTNLPEKQQQEFIDQLRHIFKTYTILPRQGVEFQYYLVQTLPKYNHQVVFDFDAAAIEQDYYFEYVINGMRSLAWGVYKE